MFTGKTAYKKKVFITIWKTTSLKVDFQIVQTMMEGAKRKVRENSRQILKYSFFLIKSAILVYK